MKYLLIAMLGITTAFAQSEPVTRIKGDKDTSYKVSPNLQVPNKQATKINSTTVRIETGNGNMLPDPSFESGVLPPSADPSVVGGYKFSCGSYGTLSVGNSAIANDGTKALKMQYGAGSGVFEAICAFSTILPDNLAGTDIEFSFEGSMKYDTKICVESYQITPVVLSQPQKCFEFNETGGVNKRFVLPYKPLYRTLSMTYRRLNTSDTTTIREIEMDTVYLGKPKSDEAIVAKFDNTTGAVFFTPIITGVTVSSSSCSKTRAMNRLLLDCKFTTNAAGGAVNLTITLPDSLTVSSQFTGGFIVGDGVRDAGASTYVKSLSVLGVNGSGTIGFSFKGDTATTAPLNYQLGSAMITGSGQTVSFNASIPIAEWSTQTNAAIVACQEGPLKCTNRFNFIYNGTNATDQFGNTYTVTKSEASNRAKEINVSSLGLTNGLRCVSANGAGNSNVGITQTSVVNSNTSVYVQTYSYSGSNVDFTFSVDCTKQGSDYNEAYDRIVIQKDDADIRSTEWLTGGFDYISNKPIYKRCFKMLSDATVSLTITTWPSGLTPVGISNFTGNLWRILSPISGASMVAVDYNSATGAVTSAAQGSGTKIGVGTTFCMEYTR